jgi:hypothetical protein
VIKVFVAMTSAIGVRCGTEAIGLGAEHRIDRFLFDLRDSPNQQSVVDNYEFAHKEIALFGFPKHSRSAFLVRPDDRSHDFITTAFFNAGYVVRLFSDEAAAIAWLEKDPASGGRETGWRDCLP